MASLPARVATWWGTWRLVIWLCAVIAVLGVLNVWQWKRAITAPLRAEVAGKARALDDSAALAEGARRTAERLQSAADAATAQLVGAGRKYAAAARARPLTNTQCAPGAARVDAVNRALGAGEEKK